MKKVLSVLSAIIILSMLVSSVAVSVSAADGNVPCFILEKSSQSDDGVINVDFKIKNNPGITALRVLVHYPPQSLELMSIEDRGFFESPISTGPVTDNPVSISWFDSMSRDISDSGLIATLRFRIKEGSPSGKIFISYDENDVFNSKFENKRFSTEECDLSAGNFIKKGDVDQNGSITIADAILVQKHIVGIHNLAGDVYSSADVDGNGSITIADAILIQKRIVKIISLL